QIKIQSTEFASSLDLASKGDFDAYLIAWSGRTDPDGNIFNFVTCRAPPALNAPHYCNPEVDAALIAARGTDKPARRLASYAKAAARIIEDRPLIYLYHNKWLWAMSAKVKGFTPYPDALIRPQDLAVQ